MTEPIAYRFFFSKRALYLVFWRPRQGQEQDGVEGWLRRIRLRVGEEVRILIVATHCDEPNPELDYPRLQSMFGVVVTGQYALDNFTGTGLRPLREALAVQASAAGLDGPDAHELPHTAASLAVAAGANVKAVQRMLGHSSAAMTLYVYAGLFGDDLDDLADGLDELHRRESAD